MAAWFQVILFIIQNLPSFLKAIKALIDMFDGDKAAPKAFINDLHVGIAEKKNFAVIHHDGSFKLLGGIRSKP